MGRSTRTRRRRSGSSRCKVRGTSTSGTAATRPPPPSRVRPPARFGGSRPASHRPRTRASATAGWGGADLGALPMDTPAMRADAAACAAAAHAFGIADGAIVEGIRTFTPEPHRGESVAVVDGVRFLDNSKATNPHASIAAVGDDEGVVLIAGGDAKGVELTPLGSLVPHLAGVVAIGAAAEQIRSVFEGRVAVRDAGSIEEATGVAFEMASSGGTVLLAPACASWDMFRDYAERGERFAAAARALEKEGART